MLEKPIKTFHNLSLNVVLGAMLCSWMFTKLPNGDSKINYFVLGLLGIATWSIYLLDRLLDVRIYPIDFSERHEFHLRNKKALYVLLSVLLVSGGVLCFYIPKEVFFYGLTIALFIGVYLLVLNKFMKKDKLQWLKEPSTAICYSLAVVGVAFVTTPSIFLSSWVLAFLFFLVASQNLLIFSYFEFFQHPDSKNTVSTFGISLSGKLIRFIGVVVLFTVLFLYSDAWNYTNKVAVCIALMSLTLSFIPARKEYFLIGDRYRWLGDGVFLYPLLLLLF